MDKETKEEMIWDKLDEIDWDDDRIPEIMPGFFNTPGDACGKVDGKMSDEHVNELFDLLELTE